MAQSNQYLTPDLKTYARYLKEDIFATLNCHTIGTIQAFDAVKQTASVAISFKRVVGDVESDYPLLLDCPVFVLFGGKGSLRFPIKKDDSCVVLFCDRNIDSWFSSGNAIKPNTNRKHDMSDGVALVGINSLKTSILNYSEDNTELLHGDKAKLSLQDAKTNLKYDTTEIDLDGTLAKVKSATAGLEVDTVLKLYNAVTDLKTVMNGLIDVLKGIQATPSIPLNAGSIAALEAYKIVIATLLK
jgi:hypothetical protein